MAVRHEARPDEGCGAGHDPAVGELDADQPVPARLSCPGPWWAAVATATSTSTAEDTLELDRLEARLREADGRRVWLQQRARAELVERGQPVTRLAVARGACRLLDEVELTPC